MTPEDFRNLAQGDIVMDVLGVPYIISENYGGGCVAVRVIDMLNPYDFTLVAKAQYTNAEP